MLTHSFLTSLSPKAAKLYFQFALLCQPGQSPLKVQISRPHLASLVGLSQRSCTRALAELQHHKLIASHPHSYRQSATYWILPHQNPPATSEPPVAHTLNQPTPRTSEPPVAHSSSAAKPSAPPLARTSHKPNPLYFQPRNTPNPPATATCEPPLAHTASNPQPCEPPLARTLNHPPSPHSGPPLARTTPNPTPSPWDRIDKSLQGEAYLDQLTPEILDALRDSLTPQQKAALRARTLLAVQEFHARFPNEPPIKIT